MKSKSILVCLLILSFCQRLLAQTDEISKKTFYKKTNQVFATLSSGISEATNFSNYASFAPLNGEFKLNIFNHVGSLSESKVPFYNISVSGKLLGENSASLFDNSLLNTGIKISGKFHIPIYNGIEFSGNQETNILDKISELRTQVNNKIELESLKYDPSFVKFKYLNEKSKLCQTDTSILKLENTIAKLNANINVLNCNEVVKTTDSLLAWNTQLVKLKIEKAQLKANTEKFDSIDSNDKLELINKQNGIRYFAESNFRSIADSLEMSLTVHGSNYLWLSIIGECSSNKYYTFNPSNSFERQFNSKVFTPFTAGLELNYIAYTGKNRNYLFDKKPNIHVINLGAVYLNTNNIEDLNTQELTDSQKYTSKDSTRVISKKYNVYTDSIIEYKALKLYLNYYYFIGNANNFAVHFFPDIEFRDTKLNPINLGLGFVLSFKNAKDNSVINIELYGKLIDVTNALHQSETNLWKRNTIGLNMGIPFNFLTSK